MGLEPCRSVGAHAARPRDAHGDPVAAAAAICLHLADRHPEAALAPALGTPARAEFYKWLIYLTNTLQAELLIYFYPERLAIDANAAAAVKLRAHRAYVALRGRLKRSSEGPRPT